MPESAPHIAPDGESSRPGRHPQPLSAAQGVLGLPLRLLDLLTLLLAVVIADGFLYHEVGGTGYALAILSWTFLFWITAPVRRLRPAVILCLLLNLILAAGLLWNAGFWSVVAPFTLLFGMAVITRSRHDHLLDGILVSAASAAFSPLRLAGHGLFVLGGLRRRREAVSQGALRYALPLSAALFIILVFGWIFSEANPVVSYWVGWFFEKLWDLVEEILPDIPRLFLWGFTASLAAGLIKPFLAAPALCEKETQETPEAASSFTETLALTALFSLAAAVTVFLFYNLLDAVYLWGKASLPEGMTFSQYARKGAGWLTFALFLSTAVIGAASSQALRADRKRGWIVGLSWAWIALDLLLALGALRRIHLYVGYNGLTPLRMTGVFGVFIVTAGLAVMGMKIAAGRNFVWIVRRYVVVFLAGVSVYAVVPEEMISSGYNTRIVMRGNPAPLVWLFEEHTWLGRRRIDPEGLPPLTPLLDHPDPVIARGVAAYLEEERERLELASRNEGWRSWQGSVVVARNALDGIRGRLTDDSTALEALRDRVVNYR